MIIATTYEYLLSCQTRLTSTSRSRPQTTPSPSPAKPTQVEESEEEGEENVEQKKTLQLTTLIQGCRYDISFHYGKIHYVSFSPYGNE